LLQRDLKDLKNNFCVVLIILQCFPHCRIIFLVLSHNVEDYSLLNPTNHNRKDYSAVYPAPRIYEGVFMWDAVKCGIIFSSVSYHMEEYSAVYPTTGKIIPWCIPHTK